MNKTGKKRNFSECEMETLLNEVDARKHILFGTPSSGIDSKCKKSEWESVCETVNAVGSEQHTPTELKKKWSDIKVKVKRRTAAHTKMWPKQAGGKERKNSPCLSRESPLLWVTLLSQGWWEHMWVTQIIPKVNMYCLFVYFTTNVFIIQVIQ